MIAQEQLSTGAVAVSGDVCVATAETVIVQLDSATRKSRPFSDVTRARLEAMLVKG